MYAELAEKQNESTSKYRAKSIPTLIRYYNGPFGIFNKQIRPCLACDLRSGTRPASRTSSPPSQGGHFSCLVWVSTSFVVNLVYFPDTFVWAKANRMAHMPVLVECRHQHESSHTSFTPKKLQFLCCDGNHVKDSTPPPRPTSNAPLLHNQE